jgi:hypothetical protein
LMLTDPAAGLGLAAGLVFDHACRRGSLFCQFTAVLAGLGLAVAGELQDFIGPPPFAPLGRFPD